jgi:hypothetical protein
MKEKPFRMVVLDAEGGTHSYHFEAKSGRHAKRDACEWVARVEWATSLAVSHPWSTTEGGHDLTDCLLS